MNLDNINSNNPIIGWWSGGVTSAVACKITIDIWGAENIRIVFIDTKNEDEDTYRFLKDCESWYGKEIERISSQKYNSIRDVWYRFLSLNVAHGAICSSELKREVRVRFLRENPFSLTVFGYDIGEPKRARSMTLNYPETNPVYPLLLFGYSKSKCVEVLASVGIEVPRSYKLGLNNNNCIKTGCVQGGIGYWQMMAIILPDTFDAMALVEHELTDLKGEPVTMLKDQSKGGGLVFLKHHPKYPNIKDISMMKGRAPKPLKECNGFCGTNDLEKNETEQEINYSPELLTPAK
jgi:hypothetical protein